MPVYTTPDQRGDHAARQQCQRKSTEDPENRPSEACANVLGEGCKAVIERSVADDLRQTQKPDGNCKAGPPLRQAEEDGASHRCAVLQPCSLTVNPCSEQQQLVNKATSRHGDHPAERIIAAAGHGAIDPAEIRQQVFRSVLNVIEYRRAGTAGMLCSHSLRAAPLRM